MSAAPNTGTIEVRLTARPEGAKMYLDDTALGTNPFVGRFKRDDGPHTLRIEAEGHTSVLRSISFASDQTLEVALEKAAAEPTSKPQPGPASGPAPSPGDAIPRPNRPKKQLDGDDPWR